jgi:hypothetical protein
MGAGERRQFAGAGPLIRCQIPFGTSLLCGALENFYPVPDDLATHAIIAKIEIIQLHFSEPMLFAEPAL